MAEIISPMEGCSPHVRTMSRPYNGRGPDAIEHLTVGRRIPVRPIDDPWEDT